MVLTSSFEAIRREAQSGPISLALAPPSRIGPTIRTWSYICRQAIGIANQRVRELEVLDDGSHVQLAPEKRFHGAVAYLLQPERLPRLTQEQAEVLAIVIADGIATRRRIEEVRGAAQLSIGSDGPVSLPRDSSETLALLLSRSLLCADRDDHANGRPLVYRPTPRLLQLFGVETLEEARGRMGVTAEYQSGSTAEQMARPVTDRPASCAPGQPRDTRADGAQDPS